MNDFDPSDAQASVETWEIMDWWWKLGAIERVTLCLSLGGSFGDALYCDPPEYVEQWLREHPEEMQ